MNKLMLSLSFAFLLLTSCKPGTENLSWHELKSRGDKLEITYKGEGEVVQFKMLEGLQQILKKNSKGVFKGQLEIPDLDNSIFSYALIIHKKDSTGKMIEIEYKPKEEGETHFLWVGNNRNISFSKVTQVKGTLKTVELNSMFLGENRKLTIYAPKYENEDIPLIYLTDGSVVEYYAPYIDQLISEDKIIPVKLVGIHSSPKNRYKEYVDDGNAKEEFRKHENFFYLEVLEEVEKEMVTWKGKRYIYGFSNGAAFCMHAGINHPEKFEEVIAFSTAGYSSEILKPNAFKFQFYPKFYLGTGRYENFTSNRIFTPKLKSQNIDVNFKEFISGHDYYVWKFEFLEYVKKRFGK